MWGRTLGRFHRLARAYAPSPALERFGWHDDENFAFERRIPQEQAAVIEVGQRLRARLKGLATTPQNCGLIHADAHAGNCLLDAAGRLTFFDFDDCCRHWFAYDVASVLFSAVLQPWIDDRQRSRERAAESFLLPFRAGYEQESAFVQEPLGPFLKLRELSLYAVIPHFWM